MLARAIIGFLLLWVVVFGCTWGLIKNPTIQARTITALIWGLPTGIFVVLAVFVFVFTF